MLKHDNLFSVTPSRRSPYFNLVEADDGGRIRLSKELPSTVVRRQDAPQTYDMNASIYIWRRATLLNESSIFLPETGVYIMPEERSHDIDSPLDFQIVSFLMRERKGA